MNRGEGLRIAARAKNGSVGLFEEEKKTKKKFSYKSRTQGFAIRKVQTTADDKDLSKQGISKSGHHGNDSSGKRLGSKPRDAAKENASSANRNRETLKGAGRALGNKESSGNKKRPPVDFVKKNKGIGGTSSGIGGANTIALTEEQLNSILKSIGAAHGVSSPSISIENGQVKVQSEVEVKEDNQDNEKDEETVGEGGERKEKDEDETKKRVKDENDDGKTVASENILELLGNLSRETDENSVKEKQTEVSSKPPSLPRTPDTNIDKSEDNTYKKGNILTDLKEKGNKWGSSVGMGNIGAVVGVQRQGQLTLQERKKLEWKKALDEQLAEKKRLQEMDNKLHRSLDVSHSESYHRKESPRQVSSNVSREPDLPKERPRKNSPDDVILRSSLGEVAQQNYIPAAMRSSFFIGGSAGQRADNYNAELKRKEQQEWIQQIEKQKREAAERKERERRKQREEESTIEHWADPVEHKSSSRGPEVSNLNQAKDDLNMQSVSTSRKEGAPSFNSSQATDILSPRQNGEMSHTRSGVNSLIDPAEMERRDIARKKHLEHMRSVQQQVEEKQRLKREAQEKRRKEEAEEEHRLAKEREDLQRQFDMENEKQRQKEREAASKQKALEDSIFNAQQEALAAKHAKRIERLAQHGHDTSNLRKSWEIKQSTEYSPRQVVHSSQQHSSPPMENQETHTIPQEKPKESLDLQASPGTRDVGTFTVNEQSTQTGPDFFSYDSLSPRLLEAIRQASAGIEYKARDNRTSQKEGKNLNKDKYSEKEEKALRRRTDRNEKNEDVEKPRQKKKHEKPKWGQNSTKKKISNSDKDLSHTSKGREERRRKRQEELLAQQERLTRRRDSLRKTSRQEVDEDARSEVSADEKISKGHSNISREPSKVDNRGGHNKSRLGATEVISQSSPEITDGDFYPFLRSEDVKLNNRSVNVTPVRDGTFEKERSYIDTNTYPTSDVYQPPVELDPLLNPERLKDSGQRQEKILEQLSHLRQGLMMKQREIELGLSPTMMM